MSLFACLSNSWQFIRNCIGSIVLTLLLVQCTSEPNKGSHSAYFVHDIGDIVFNKDTDHSNFHICDSSNIVTRRNGLSFPGGHHALLEKVQSEFEYQESFDGFSGYIVVRFIVNCNGETDRFRVATLDGDFVQQKCPPTLSKMMLEITKGLNSWEIRSQEDKDIDFSKFLNFKFDHGKIVNIIQ